MNDTKVTYRQCFEPGCTATAWQDDVRCLACIAKPYRNLDLQHEARVAVLSAAYLAAQPVPAPPLTLADLAHGAVMAETLQELAELCQTAINAIGEDALDMHVGVPGSVEVTSLGTLVGRCADAIDKAARR